MNKLEFYVVATPIGNLGDITFRAIETLKKVDLILCEDTRMTSRLLNHYEIKKPLLSYHQHSKISRIEVVIEHIQNGKTLALVTDAGTPGISDPGNELVKQIEDRFKDEIKITPIPGPAAITTLISVSGIDMSKFVFLGFPPNKKGRETFFKKAMNFPFPVVYYDSPYRFLKNLELVNELSKQQDSKKRFIVGRELTKMFEEIVRGDAQEIKDHFEEGKGKIKGEFAIILYE